MKAVRKMPTKPAAHDNDEVLLTPEEVAKRWRLRPRTLERWRWEGKGPPWVKLGRIARYRLRDILAFEQEYRP